MKSGEATGAMTDADFNGNTASLIVLHPSMAKLLCVRHPNFGRWMFPGGKVEPGEAPHQAAAREVMEEVGLRIAITDLSDLPDWHRQGNLRLPQPFAIIRERLPHSGASYVDFVYVGISETTSLSLHREVSQAEWLDLSELRQLDTSFPIKEMAAAVLKRAEKIRTRA